MVAVGRKNTIKIQIIVNASNVIAFGENIMNDHQNVGSIPI
jgi:hypothetical protein